MTPAKARCRCGEEYPTDYPRCPFCGLPAEHSTSRPGGRSRAIFILLAVFLGGLGVHNFYAGYVGRAAGQIALSLVGLFVSPFVFLALLLWIIIEIATTGADADGREFA